MKQDLYISKLSANDESVKIIEWYIDDFAYIKPGDRILLVETSKTMIEIESENSGFLLKRCQPQQIISFDEAYATLFTTNEALIHYQQNRDSVMSQTASTAKIDILLGQNFSNAAKKYIQEHNLNQNDFSDIGLVTVETIKNKQQQMNQPKLPINKAAFPDFKIETLSFSKLCEINNLTKGKEGVVGSSLTIQLNSDEIRQKLSSLTWLNKRILPYILYVFSKLLTTQPKFASFFHEKQIALYNRVNLGLAIDLGQGLKVVVIEDADQLSLFDLQMKIVDCIASYHENSLDSAALMNSTVTVTDLSHDDILHFQPVLNANQAVILGIGGDKTLPGSPISLTIVFDHRLLSGQEVAAFLKLFKEKLLTTSEQVDFNNE